LRACPSAAVGEVGLDASPRGVSAAALDVQLSALRAQLRVASDAGRPVQLHVVRAHAEAAAALGASPPRAGALVHSFGGSAADAARFAALPLRVLLSFQGAIVAPVAAAWRTAAARPPLPAARGGASKGTMAALAAAPLDSLAFETDSPAQPFPTDAEYEKGWHTPLLEQACALLGCAVPDAAGGGGDGCDGAAAACCGGADAALPANTPHRVALVILAAATWRARARAAPAAWPEMAAAAAEAAACARANAANIGAMFGAQPSVS